MHTPAPPPADAPDALAQPRAVGAPDDANAHAEPAPAHAARPRFPALRALEFVALFFVPPVVFVFTPLRTFIIPSLLVGGALCLFLLLRDRTFDRRRLFNPGAVRAALPAILKRFALAAALMTVGVLLLTPDKLFDFPRREPALWALIMVAYPLFSVYPQELIFRTFLFQRYEPVFGTGAGIIVASALAFGFAHILFLNLFAVLMTIAGGALFALTYRRTRSTIACSIEHALYGDFIFTIGLGLYFYAGPVPPG